MHNGDANVDSEYRFHAARYPISGVLLVRAAGVRAFSAGLLLAASGRTLSVRKLGPPNALQRVLMALEFAIPAVIVPWQAAVAREHRSGDTPAESGTSETGRRARGHGITGR